MCLGEGPVRVVDPKGSGMAPIQVLSLKEFVTACGYPAGGCVPRPLSEEGITTAGTHQAQGAELHVWALLTPCFTRQVLERLFQRGFRVAASCGNWRGLLPIQQYVLCREERRPQPNPTAVRIKREPLD